MQNKRGVELLGKNLVGIIIAVIGVGLLIYASVVLFQTYAGDKADTQAKAQLASVDKILSELNADEEKEEQLLSPYGWHLVSFDKQNNFNNNFEKPDILLEKNAICLCKSKECKFCKETDFPVKSAGELINIEIPEDIVIKKLNNYYEIRIGTIAEEE